MVTSQATIMLADRPLARATAAVAYAPPRLRTGFHWQCRPVDSGLRYGHRVVALANGWRAYQPAQASDCICAAATGALRVNLHVAGAPADNVHPAHHTEYTGRYRDKVPARPLTVHRQPGPDSRSGHLAAACDAKAQYGIARRSHWRPDAASPSQ